MYKGEGRTWFCFIIFITIIPCLLSLQNLPLKNSGRNVRRSVRLRTADERRRIAYLRRRSGGWPRRRKFGDERRRQNRGGRRRRNGRGVLRRLRRSMRGRRSRRRQGQRKGKRWR
jgi:hypothetical protein